MSRSSLAANPPDKAAAAAPAQHLYKNPPNSIEKVTGWQKMSEGNLSSWLAESRGVGGGVGLESQSGRGSGGGGSLCRTSGLGMGLGRGRAPSFEALRGAVADLYRLDDFELTSLGAGFFSDVYKVTHKTSSRVLVLKMNKYKSNRTNMLKEIQLMNKLNHPNILRFEAVCVHEGQLHALTEYIEGGNLEELIQDTERPLSWSTRISLSLHIAKGLMYLNSQGMFHRDLTSKNILIKKEPKLTAVIGDFGLATRIPKKDDPRLTQVGSPYWMSPECLRGEYYDHQADIFSFGIVLCELIARCDADPDSLPRTQNFGVDYILFAELCPACPPDYLKLAFTCVSLQPWTRPRSNELVSQLKVLLEEQRLAEKSQEPAKPVSLKRFISEGEFSVKKSPSEKARLHSVTAHTVKSVGEEMCLLDPHYTPRNSICVNPFATLPRLREGRKLIGSTVDLFSSCFELPSPRVASPTEGVGAPTRSLPASPPTLRQASTLEVPSYLLPPSRHPHHQRGNSPPPPGTNRVSLLKRLYSNRGCVSQDDSTVGLSSSGSGLPEPAVGALRRWGSVESGFCSVSDDWFSGPISSRSICSSLLTVSDLEEDLRMASAFLANKRTSSVFTDSIDDLSSRLDDISNTGPGGSSAERGYEKDIRDIVDYFERNCATKDHHRDNSNRDVDTRTSPEIARSQKIEKLIKRVAENKTRARLRRHSPQQNLQVCDGIVRSKLQIFDQKRRQPRARAFDQSGFVNSRRALFDPPPPAKPRKQQLVSDLLRQRDSGKLSSWEPNKLSRDLSKLTRESNKLSRESSKLSRELSKLPKAVVAASASKLDEAKRPFSQQNN